MKTLQNYTEQKQTDLFNECGAFFAFGTQQFNDAKKEGVKYVDMGYGLISPKENAKKLWEGLQEINKQGIAEDIAENGITNIIKRELINYECYYTSDIDDCVEALKSYDITEAQILEVYRSERHKHADQW